MENIIFRQIVNYTSTLYDLLLLADPSLEQINSYLHISKVYGIYCRDELIGVYVLYPLHAESVEIKNIGVKDNYQGKGIGTILLQHAIEVARANNYKQIVIGTADSSIYQLHFYKKLGFEMHCIKKNFFIDNYKESIFENGLQARDMIVLVKYLNNNPISL